MHVDPDKWTAAVEAVVAALKQRFPNLTVEEVLKLAHTVTKAAVTAYEKE